jgi:hypothetical protein
VAVACAVTAASGSEATLLLPDTDAEVAARVVRATDGLLGLVFLQEAATLAQVDRALDHVARAPTAALAA